MKRFLNKTWASAFAEEWVAAWNAHDLERILAHYAEDFEMTSPLIIERMGEPSGMLKGKAQVRPYWALGLAAIPPLQFELLEVFVGVNSVGLYYRSVGRRLVMEVLVFNEQGQVIRGVAQHAPLLT